jgi:hypothetical protein
MSCHGGLECVDGFCEPAPPAECGGSECPQEVPCDSQYDCAGGELCQAGFCSPGGGDVEQCDDDPDCDGDLPDCVGGVCTSTVILSARCDAATVCSAGYDCVDGSCSRRAGRCELDADCGDGQECLSGWCGAQCSGDGACSTDETCALQRCVPRCESAFNCAFGEACVEGGCVPEYAFLGHPGGDQSLWEIDGDPTQPRDSGGCSAGGDAGAGGLASACLALVAVVIGRRKRRRVHDAAVRADRGLRAT